VRDANASNKIVDFGKHCGRLTQWPECFLYTEEVGSSTLSAPTIQKDHYNNGLFVLVCRGRESNPRHEALQALPLSYRGIHRILAKKPRNDKENVYYLVTARVHLFQKQTSGV
jgi:hypothetical protein